MTVPTYPAYKESEVEWVGSIPEQWRRLPLKRAIRFTTGWTPPTGRDDLYGGDYPWVTIGDMKGREIKTTAKGVTIEAVQLGRGEVSPAGSLLFSFKLSIGQVAFAGADVYTNEAIATFLPSSKLSLGYAYYSLPLFVSANAVENIYGAKLLNQDLINNADLILPPLDEQSAIAAFLDRETGKIDTLVAEQERLIALLKEKRQAVISHAVTKGLNPDAPMKESGVPWLGKVPAHWEIMPLTRVVTQFVDYRGATPTKVSVGIPLITATAIRNGRIDHQRDPVFISEAEYKDRMTRGFPNKGDLLLTTEAPLGETALVDEERIAPGQRMILMKFDSKYVDGKYLLAHFNSDFGKGELLVRASGSTASGIRADRLRASLVAVPPILEQHQICQHIEHQTLKFSVVEAEVSCAITLLRERRAALISAAVTGKIDVRDTASAAQSAA